MKTPTATETTKPSGSSTETNGDETRSLSEALLMGRYGSRTDQKAARLLVTGRVLVKRVDRQGIEAEVRGDSGVIYQCGWSTERQRWTCSCPARTDCSHLRAVWAVVAVKK